MSRHIPFAFLSAAIFMPIGCSAPLHRPILAKDELRTLTGYYVYQGQESESALPKTKADCETYLKKPLVNQETVITAVCNLNLKRVEEVQKEATALADTCIGRVILYDLAVDGLIGHMSKGDRFTVLQALLDCSPRKDYIDMIEVRAKLAHYE
jgi:hypothetical protein